MNLNNYPPEGAFGDDYPMLEAVTHRARENGSPVLVTQEEFSQAFEETDAWIETHDPGFGRSACDERKEVSVSTYRYGAIQLEVIGNE